MLKRTKLAFISSCLLSFGLLAAEPVEELLQQTVQAYGGEALTGMSGYRITEGYLTITIGQSHSPTLNELARSKSILAVDLANGRAAVDSWNTGRSGGFQGNTVSDGEKAFTVNHQAKTFGEAGNADPYIFAGGIMRTTDALLAYELSKAAENAKLGEDVRFMNRNHHVVTIPFPSSSDLNLYIDAETKLISKMVRDNPQLGALEYVYSDYKSDQGITYSARTNFFIAGVPNLISTGRKIEFNPSFSDTTFSVPEAYTAEAERIDTSAMKATKISNNVYHVGQGNAYTLFVDTGSAVVATGGYGGLSARYDFFKSDSDIHKALTHQIVTHHHSDHVGGLVDAVSLGAKLVTVADNTRDISQNVSPAPDARDFLIISSRLTLGAGTNRVEVYEVSTTHAASNLIVYVPSSKLIFIADHFGSPFAKGLPAASENTVSMLSALDELGLNIAKISTAHSARIFTMKEMRDSVAAFKPSLCTGGKPVCDI